MLLKKSQNETRRQYNTRVEDKIQRFYQIKDIMEKCNEGLRIEKDNNSYSALLRKMEDLV